MVVNDHHLGGVLVSAAVARWPVLARWPMVARPVRVGVWHLRHGVEVYVTERQIVAMSLLKGCDKHKRSQITITHFL